MGKTFNVARNVMAAYGAVCLVGGIILTAAAHAEAKKKTADETVTKKHGKTYFKVQDGNRDETQPMGFHVG